MANGGTDLYVLPRKLIGKLYVKLLICYLTRKSEASEHYSY